MSQEILKPVEKTSMKTEVPQFEIGDTVDVHTKILEGDKERIQIFSGTVIARSGSGSREMFTVRRIVAGEGVERKFPLHSPRIAKVEVKRSSVVRRAKLYFLRDRVGKAVRLRNAAGEATDRLRGRFPTPLALDSSSGVRHGLAGDHFAGCGGAGAPRCLWEVAARRLRHVFCDGRATSRCAWPAERLGEIDLVAIDGRTVVFVEVKTRRSVDVLRRHSRPWMMKSNAGFTRAALGYLRRHDLLEERCTF